MPRSAEHLVVLGRRGAGHLRDGIGIDRQAIGFVFDPGGGLTLLTDCQTITDVNVRRTTMLPRS